MGLKKFIKNIIKKVKIFKKKIISSIMYGDDSVFFSIGENCLADDILNRYSIKSFSSPYSSGRTNIEYVLYFEKENFISLLNKENLHYEIRDNKKVPVNNSVKKLENHYYNSSVKGFEFTHHDVIDDEEVRNIFIRRCQRLVNLKNKHIYMLYHHRICNQTNEKLLIKHLQEIIKIYMDRGNDAKVYLFTQVIVSNSNERKIDKQDLGNGIYIIYTEYMGRKK